MIEATHIHEALSRLPRIQGRGENTPQRELDAAFATLGAFRDGGVFAGSFDGDSGWERHAGGDELVQILDGETEFDVITDDGKQTITLTAGMILVVPRGCWHRFRSATGVTVLTATPQPTDHTYVDDPRD